MSLRRHINIWQVATENLWRYRARTISILIPLLVVIGAAAAVTLVKDGLQRDAELSMAMLPDVTIQRLIGGRVERLPLDDVEQIKEIEHVKKVVPRVWGYVPLKAKGQDVAYTLMGIDVENMPISPEIGLSIEEGRFLKEGDKGKMIVGKAFATVFNIRAGDKIRLKDILGNEDTFEVIGVFTTAVQIYTADLLLTSMEDARDFFGYSENEASDLCIYLDHPLHAGSVAQKIITTFDSTRALSRDTLADITRQAYGGRSGVFQLMWMILLLTVMLIAWAQASNINIEMKKEIGILKAIGWSTTNIIELKMLESLIIALLGVFGGLVLGIGYLLIGAPGIKEYFLGWATVYPEFPIPIYINPQSIILLFVIGIFPLLVATVIPAWLAGIIEPDTAIRG